MRLLPPSIAILAGFVTGADIAAGRLVLVVEGIQVRIQHRFGHPSSRTDRPRKVRAFIEFMSAEFSGSPHS
jgi:DNA-binding transcriptional LysR family regulator